VTDPEIVVDVHEQALSNVAMSLADVEVCEAIRRQAATPFDVARPPLFRAHVLTADRGLGLLLLIADGLVADWWSLSGIVRRFKRGASADGRRQPRSRTPRAPGELVIRQADVLRLRRSVKHWFSLWATGLIVPLTCADIPFALPSLSVPTRRVAFRLRAIDDAEVARLRCVADRFHVTLRVVVLSAVAEMLHRVTQKPLLSFWTDCDVSGEGATSPIRGPAMSHAHVFTVEHPQESSVRALVHAVAMADAAVACHQDVPLDAVWRVARQCLLSGGEQVAVQYIQGSAAGASGSADETEWPLLDTDPQVGLHIRAYQTGERLRFVMDYCEDRLTAVAADRLLAELDDAIAWMAC
jgi:hypothetical protein